ncbi:RAMP superfamily CRISPR-associated protein [Succinimonas sp.]|uniref:RAMP superfamily CRISPR-associated protein n=1 Tax=Succinimonas sp. TaxID=1936151 RepID=UPI0038699291
MKKYFVLETLDDVIIGSSNAAAFVSETLDYIPGSTVMGAVCSLYGREYLEPDTLNLFFQENMTVFSDFLPLTTDGEETLPAPMSLHYEKKKTTPLLNFLKKELKQEDKQYEQLRGDQRDSNFKSASPDKTITARTAIDYKTNTAKESALYNRDALTAGQCFLGYCLIPDSFENDRPGNSKRTKEAIEKARDAIFDILKDGRVIRLGGSRGSEFGRVRIHEVTDSAKMAQNCVPEPGPVDSKGKRQLVLWCLSNAEFLDTVTSYDSPIPDNPAMLWALFRKDINATFKPGKSFVRSGKTRLYNNKRGGLESARVFVCRGSVLVYEYSYQGDEAELRNVLQRLQEDGVGLSRHLGCGRVLVNPSCLVSQGEIKDGVKLFESGFRFKPAASCSSEQIQDLEVQWLKDMHKFALEDAAIDKLSDKLLEKIIDLYEAGRSYLGIKDGDDFGPGKTQWMALKTALTSLLSKDFKKDDIRKEIKGVTVAGKAENRDGKEMQEDKIWNIKLEYRTNDHKERAFDDCFLGLVDQLFSEEGSSPSRVCKAIVRCIELRLSLHDPREPKELNELKNILKNILEDQESAKTNEENE